MSNFSSVPASVKKFTPVRKVETASEDMYNKWEVVGRVRGSVVELKSEDMVRQLRGNYLNLCGQKNKRPPNDTRDTWKNWEF